MLYSDYYKYIYYAPQRTGTSTMVAVLKKFYDAAIYRGKHAVLDLPRSDDYFIFATVRNPYNRFLSTWNFLIGRDRVFWRFERVLGWWGPITKKLAKYRLDHVIHTETMDKDFKRLPFVRQHTIIPQLNKSCPFLIGLTKRQKELVKNWYFSDFKAFGYDPDNCTIKVFDTFGECLNPDRRDVREMYNRTHSEPLTV